MDSIDRLVSSVFSRPFRCAEIAEPTRAYYVQAASAAVACAFARRDSPGTAFVHTIATDPAHRNRGLCQKLLGRIIADHPDAMLYLTVEASNAQAQRCYEKVGFVTLPKPTTDATTKTDVLYMVRAKAPQTGRHATRRRRRQRPRPRPPAVLELELPQRPSPSSTA